MFTKQVMLLAGSLGFSLIATASYLSTSNAMHALIYGAMAAFILGVFGFIIGNIMDNPAGNHNKFWEKFWSDLITLKPEKPHYHQADAISPAEYGDDNN